MFFEIGEIPSGKKRGWTVFIDGVEQDVKLIKISSKFGALTYGLRPEGYDGWAFCEQGRGGAITLPYTFTSSGDLLVGLVAEQRPNMGDVPVYCAIGGFVEPCESHQTAQAREVAEEAGLDSAQAKELEGVPSNSNRAFFVADALAQEGVHAFGLRLPFERFKKDTGESWKLMSATFLPGFKKADDIRFFPWKVAVHTSPDALARAAIAQLIAEVL